MKPTRRCVLKKTISTRRIEKGAEETPEDSRRALATLRLKVEELREEFVSAHSTRPLQEYERILGEYEASKFQRFYAAVDNRLDSLLNIINLLKTGKIEEDGTVQVLRVENEKLNLKIDNLHHELKMTNRQKMAKGDLSELDGGERQKEVGSLKEQLRLEQSRCGMLEKEVDKLRGEQRKLMDYVGVYKTNTEKLEQKTNKLVDKLAKLQVRNEELEETTAENGEKRNEELEEENIFLRKELGFLQRKLRKYEEELGDS